MKRSFKIIAGTLGALALALMPLQVQGLSWNCDDGDAACITRMQKINACWDETGDFQKCVDRVTEEERAAKEAAEAKKETTEQTAQKETNKTEVGPTFTTDNNTDQGWARLGVGRNTLLVGNNLTSNITTHNGLLFILGNSLNLNTQSEYSFILGNIINFSGVTTRDLYLAGNSVTIVDSAQVGRDVFVAANELSIEADIDGDLAATGATVILKDVEISGNVNLAAGKIIFDGDVTIGGALTYNDNAKVQGLESVKYGTSESYHVEEVDPQAVALMRFYSKMISIASLVATMIVVCAVCSKRLHAQLEQEDTLARFGTNLAMGLGVLMAVPIVAVFCFITFVGAPLGIIGLVLYAVAIYVAQGVTGAWLGHMLLEKLCRMKGANIFLESALGIVILGMLSFIPYFGILVGFLSLLLGLGLIVAFFRNKAVVKPATANTPAAKSAEKTTTKAKTTKKSIKSGTKVAKD